MSTKSFTIVAIIEAKPGKEQALKAMLTSLVKPTLQEEGCINYDLHQSLDNPGKFMFYENWTSEETHAMHMKTPHIQEWRSKKDDLLAKLSDVTQWCIIADD